jgi:hypothetical protein
MLLILIENVCKRQKAKIIILANLGSRNKYFFTARKAKKNSKFVYSHNLPYIAPKIATAQHLTTATTNLNPNL